MSYNVNDIPFVNPSFTCNSIGQGRIMSSVDGEFKLIQCSPSALDDVFTCIDGQYTFLEIEKLLGEKYPIEGVKSYLSALIQENVLKIKDDTQSKTSKVIIQIIGTGILAETLKQILENSDIFQVNILPLNDFIKQPEFKSGEIFIVSPEEATYYDMLKLNHIMMKVKKTYLPFYYNGYNTVIGPLIIPGGTACIECRTVHHLSNINNKLSCDNKVDLKSVKELLFSQKISSSCFYSELVALSEIVMEELLRIVHKSEDLVFLDCEKHFPLRNIISEKSVSLYSTTECEACNSLRNYCKWNKGMGSQFKETVSFCDDSIRYNIGGLRTRNDEEAKEFITQAIRRAGLKVKVTRAYTPFDSIIPVFRANVENILSNKTPYSFRNIITHGKGMTESQSFLSASFEMAERLSASYYGEIPVVEATFKEAESKAINISEINNTIKNNDTCFERFTPDLPIDWVWAKSLISGECKLIPAFMTFLGGTKFKGQFISNGSSGLAAGATLDDAILQGMLEVIEHDAWMIGQANRFALPQIDHNTSENEKLKEYIYRINAMGYKVITRDYTNDLGISVFRTWIVNPNNYTHYAISGVGASNIPELALERSVTEAIQSADIVMSSSKTYFGRTKSEYLGSAKDSVYSLDYFKVKDILGESETRSMPKATYSAGKNVREIIQAITAQLQQKMPSCDVLYVDLTRSILEVPTVRIIITGDLQILNYPLISVSPRLYKYGRTMNYTNVDSSYEELYLGAYPH